MSNNFQHIQTAMKKILVPTVLLFVLIGYSAFSQNFLTLADAEKILGEKAHIKDSSSTLNNEVSTFNSSFAANSKDEKTGKLGIIYFMYEHFSEVSSAKDTYASIKTSNEKNGITVLHDIGDEAYFHTDNENFYFILVRKGSKMFRMKVNKLTSKTSMNEFKAIATKITSGL